MGVLLRGAPGRAHVRPGQKMRPPRSSSMQEASRCFIAMQMVGKGEIAPQTPLLPLHRGFLAQRWEFSPVGIGFSLTDDL